MFLDTIGAALAKSEAGSKAPTPGKSTGRCGACVHFSNDPATIEDTFRGLSAMSSGHASVRAHDGLCSLHEVYLSFRDTCGNFSAQKETV
jgi:hypothetical protein